MEERKITCINCPMGCRMSVKLDGGVVLSVEDNFCKRGEKYARQECVEPLRMITAVARVEGRRTPVSAKTAEPIAKARIFDCMQEINSSVFTPPIRMGDTLIENLAHTGIALIATKNID